MISYVLPTRDRPAQLEQTLAALGRLDSVVHERSGGGEVLVVDNASARTPALPRRLANGLAVRLLCLARNEGAAARNVAAGAARGEWLVMLDDDSAPMDDGFAEALLEAPPDVAAIGGEVLLPDGRREAGGLPEVYIGCGAAVRREAFLASGGYDAAFGYYVEEYDLCAKLLLGGWRVVHDRRLRVLHFRAAAGRDMNVVLARLVRNNGWVARRYAPIDQPDAGLDHVLRRCRAIAEREGALDGFCAGLTELEATIDHQPRRPMDAATFERFTGRAAVDAVLAGAGEGCPPARVAVVDEGRSAWIVHEALAARGVAAANETEAQLLAIGTLSPGPLWDAWERRAARGEALLPPWIHGHGTCTPAGKVPVP